jgi:hypothetical protein
VDNAVGPIEDRQDPLTGSAYEVEDPVFNRGGSGLSTGTKGGRDDINSDHLGAPAVVDQETHDSTADEAGGSGDDYRAHRPTMPL